jgi:arylsulfatase
MRDRPNILLVMTDQQRADSIARAGGSDTPHLDRLAGRGVLFGNAYSSSTTCVPARTSLMTGMLPHRVPTVEFNERGRSANGLALRPGSWTIARALREAGYQTALLGKMHFLPMHADHGFDHMRTCEHLPAGYAQGAKDDYRRWLESTGRSDLRFVRPSTPKTFPYEAAFHPTAWVTREAQRFLQERDRGRPYFAVVSFPNPHTPYDPPEPYASMYRPEDQVVPPEGIGLNDDLPGPFRDAVFRHGPDRVFAPVRVDALPPPRVRAVLAAIRAVLRQIDDAMAELLKAVDLDDTVVFFLSDHGDYGGHRGLLGKAPWIPFDDLARVPSFAAGAGIAGGRRIEAPVQSFDFVPTTLELAGAAPPEAPMDAISLMPVLRGGDADPGRRVYSCTVEGWPMLRRGRYKNIWHSGYDIHVLYDLEADPDEAANLAADPAHASLLCENAQLLRKILDGAPAPG